jgi:hypothetical protein
VHEVADDEAEVALFGAGGHLEAAFGCVGEAVDFGEGHLFGLGVGFGLSLVGLLRIAFGMSRSVRMFLLVVSKMQGQGQ